MRSQYLNRSPIGAATVRERLLPPLLGWKPRISLQEGLARTFGDV